MDFVRPTVASVEYIANNMRYDDMVEIICAGAPNPLTAIQECVKISQACVVASYQDEPMVIYGMSKPCLSSGVATIWMLGTVSSAQLPKEFMVYTRKVLKEMLKEAGTLENYIHCGNKTNIKWLKALGFKFGKPAKMGTHNQHFMKFTLEAKDV